MKWHTLYFGKLQRAEIKEAVKDVQWQLVRVNMKGMPTQFKYDTLQDWLVKCNGSREAQVQITNYVTALSRGGIIQPEEYNTK